MNFIEHLTTFLPEQAVKKLSQSLELPSLGGLRMNPKKIKKEKIMASFSFLQPHPLCDQGFIFEKSNHKLGLHPYHFAGAYYLQEPSAMLAGTFLPITSNDFVLDVCASPGGKSTHISDCLGDNGLLVSNEYIYARASVLSENIERYGISNAIVIQYDGVQLSNKFSGYFDKVILDAPCSGSGMFRKNNLSKESWSMDKVLQCSELQKKLIMSSYQCLKKGGFMLYSTCSFSIQENEEVIQFLLDKTNASLVFLPFHPLLERGILLQETVRVYPYSFPGEGHFYCLIQCNDEHKVVIKENQAKIPNSYLKIFLEFSKENFTKSFLSSQLCLLGEHLHLLPKNCFNISQIKTLRNGIHLGEFRNTLFFPSHSIATSFRKEDFKQVLNLDSTSSEISAYLQGNILPCKYDKGYVLVTVDDIPLGLGKAVQFTLKNHYPKGLRLF